MEQRIYLYKLFILFTLLISGCNKTVCPEPEGKFQQFKPILEDPYCTTTSPNLIITNCTESVLEAINRILYSRKDPYNGLFNRSCIQPENWEPYQVVSNESIYQLFIPMDTCSDGLSTVKIPYRLIADHLSNKYEFYVVNAKEDLYFQYNGYCFLNTQYRAHIDLDWNCISFYYIDGSGNRIDIPKNNLITVISLSLDCDYINTNSHSFSSAPFFNHSAFGIKVKLEVNDLAGLPPGKQTIQAYIKSVTGNGGEFGAWTSSVFWKTLY